MHLCWFCLYLFFQRPVHHITNIITSSSACGKSTAGLDLSHRMPRTISSRLHPPTFSGLYNFLGLSQSWPCCTASSSLWSPLENHCSPIVASSTSFMAYYMVYANSTYLFLFSLKVPTIGITRFSLKEVFLINFVKFSFYKNP